MDKYNRSFKQHIIGFYLQNGKNRSLTRRYFQLNETILEHLINRYNRYGIKE